MKENYIVEVDNVEGEVVFVNAPKDPKKGFSYAIKIKNPQRDLEPYLDGYSSIKIYTMDKEPRYSTKQKITIPRMGITQWEGNDGKLRYSAHPINQAELKPQSELKPLKPFPPEKEEKVDWDAKEFRMVSMNALSHATEIVNSLPVQISLTEKIQKVKETADEFVKWVYRKRV